MKKSDTLFLGRMSFLLKQTDLYKATELLNTAQDIIRKAYLLMVRDGMSHTGARSICKVFYDIATERIKPEEVENMDSK